jgi:sigma-B regulation protein RsbU (phosphoserine phosphatase)
MSDGVTEAADPQGKQLGEAGLCDLLQKNRARRGTDLLESLMWDLSQFAADDLGDDVSAVLFEFGGAKENID